MKLNIDDIRRQYEELTDDALLEIDRGDLVDAARQCYDAELARRRLRAAVPPSDAAEQHEDLEVAGVCSTRVAADEVRARLRAAGIHGRLATEYAEDEAQALMTAYRGVPVLAAAEDAEAVREIVDAVEADAEHLSQQTDASHVRHGLGSARALLSGGAEIAEFAQEVFGGLDLEHDADHIEVMVGDSVILLSGAAPGSVYVYVRDVDEAYRQALETGAVSVAAPENKLYRERVAVVKDTAGNTWWIATYLGE